jgi:OCT family organic cation transporter-like MFS transporter 4/5
MEFMGPNWRAAVANQYLTIFSFGFMSLSLIAYYARDWHTMELVIALCVTPVFAFHFVLPQSFRWLYSKDKINEARVAVLEFSDKNGGSLDLNYLEKVEAAANSGNTQQVKILEVFKFPKMKWITVNCMYGWFVTSMVYYGLGLNAGSLTGNLFINNVINGCFEIAARLIAPFILEWKVMGRRGSLFFFFMVCSLSCIGSLILTLIANCEPSFNPEDCSETPIIPEDCNTYLLDIASYTAFLGKFAVAGTFSVLYVYR